MKSSVVLLIALAFVSGCSSVTVTRDYDRNADFSSMKTYAWKHAEQPETGNPRIDNDLLDQRIRDAINADLGGKGFSIGDAADADFLVVYFIDYKQRIGGNSVSFGVGAGRYDRYGGVGYNTTISDYDESRLTIDVIDRATDKMIWRGVGRRSTYEYSKPDKITKVVNDAVPRIMKSFPPKK